MEPLGLLSLAYDVLKDKNKFFIPTLNGIISNCIDKVSEHNKINRNYLIELLSSDEIYKQIDNYKKSGLNPERIILNDNLRRMLQSNEINVDVDKIINEIIYEFENVISSNPEIYKKIQLNYSRNTSEKVDQIYEMMKKFNPEQVTSQYAKNTFTGYDFHISWPENWIKLSESEISAQLDNLEEIESTFGIPNMRIPVVFQVWTKKKYDDFHPNIFITVEDIKTKTITDILNPLHKEVFENMANIVRYDIDEHFNTVTIETRQNLLVDNYQIQKWIIRNMKLYNLVITELTEEAMKKEPSLLDEIKYIAQSFSWI